MTREGTNIVGDDFMLATVLISLLILLLLMLSLKELWKEKIGYGTAESLENAARKTYQTINTLVDQKQLDEKKLDLFNNFLQNL